MSLGLIGWFRWSSCSNCSVTYLVREWIEDDIVRCVVGKFNRFLVGGMAVLELTVIDVAALIAVIVGVVDTVIDGWFFADSVHMDHCH